MAHTSGAPPTFPILWGMWAGLLRYLHQFSAMAMLLHPSVLISISPTPPLSTDSSREQFSSPLSASGFIIAVDGNGDVLMVTTASWLSEVLEIQFLDTEQVSWKFRGDMSIQEPQFVVLVQRACDSVSLILMTTLYLPWTLMHLHDLECPGLGLGPRQLVYYL